MLSIRSDVLETEAYFLKKARQCRRLLRATNDERASRGLSAMADEFEAKAKAAQAASHTIDLLGDGSPGSLVPNDDSERR